MSAPLDVGTAICRAVLDAVDAVMDARSIGRDERPRLVVHATGAAIPVADACDGMLWARVANAMPTDGSERPFTATREVWSPPAIGIPIELGVLFCHQNITDDGGWITAEAEAEYAARDGMWRAVLLETLAYEWKPADDDRLAPAVLSQSLGTWIPIGPDGGYSGGLIVATVITTGLWLC